MQNPKGLLVGSVAVTVLFVIGVWANEACACLSPEDTMVVQLRNLCRESLQIFHNDHNAYPTTQQGLDELLACKLVQRTPVDAWGKAFRYESDGQTFEIRSAGRNAQFGDEDDIVATDKTNWRAWRRGQKLGN